MSIARRAGEAVGFFEDVQRVACVSGTDRCSMCWLKVAINDVWVRFAYRGEM